MIQKREGFLIKQYHLAKLLGVSIDTVKSWECGRATPSKKNIEKIEKFLNVKKILLTRIIE